MIEITTPDAPPQQPDWLTASGEAVWLDNIGRVMAVGLATEADSDLLGLWCNLVGACGEAWRAGAVPPGWAVTESRRLGELFGLAGARSRIVRGLETGPSAENPFAHNSPRRPE